MHTQLQTQPPLQQLQTQRHWMDTLEHEARTLVAQLDAHPEARMLFNGSISTERYAAYLIQTYHYVRWTTPLLAQAGQRMKALGQHTALGELLLQKAAEERGHERWLLADLKNLGWTTDEVEGTAIYPAIAAYVAWNCFTTEAGSPTAFLGAAYVLEYLSVHRAGMAVENLLARKTIPNIHRAVTFLRGHAGADGDHVAELAAVLRGLTDRQEQEALLLSAHITRTLYPGFFSEVAWPAQQATAA